MTPQQAVTVVALVALCCCFRGCDAAVSAEARAQLVDFLGMFGGNGWFVKDGWDNLVVDGATTQSDPCTWFGVFCDVDDSVQEIQLRRNNLRGSANALNLSALTSLTVLDLSYNAISGELPVSLFMHPSLERIRFDRNMLSTVPQALVQGNLSASVTLVQLEMNRFPCPLPRAENLPAVSLRVWRDLNTTGCQRTPSRTLEVSVTAVVEPPVPSLGSEFTEIPALLAVTELEVNETAITELFVRVLGDVLVAEDVISGPATNVTVTEYLSVDVVGKSVTITFTDSATIDLRRNIYSRFQSAHVSTRSLLLSSVVNLAATNAPPESPRVAAPEDSGVSRDVIVVIVVIGTVVVVALVGVIVVFWCRRRRAFVNVPAMPGGPPQRTGTFVSQKSLRMDPALSHGHSMAYNPSRSNSRPPSRPVTPSAPQ